MSISMAEAIERFLPEIAALLRLYNESFPVKLGMNRLSCPFSFVKLHEIR